VWLVTLLTLNLKKKKGRPPPRPRGMLCYISLNKKKDLRGRVAVRGEKGVPYSVPMGEKDPCLSASCEKRKTRPVTTKTGEPRPGKDDEDIPIPKKDSVSTISGEKD